MRNLDQRIDGRNAVVGWNGHRSERHSNTKVIEALYLYATLGRVNGSNLQRGALKELDLDLVVVLAFAIACITPLEDYAFLFSARRRWYKAFGVCSDGGINRHDIRRVADEIDLYIELALTLDTSNVALARAVDLHHIERIKDVANLFAVDFRILRQQGQHIG